MSVSCVKNSGTVNQKEWHIATKSLKILNPTAYSFWDYQIATVLNGKGNHEIPYVSFIIIPSSVADPDL
jgi:hypothetical protein